MLDAMTQSFIALGSNLGRRQTALRDALRRIDALPDCHVISVARFRQTEPVNAPPGSPRFMNSVALVETNSTAAELLRQLNEIEKLLGRDRSVGEPNAPRTIDLDLLLFGQEVIHSAELTVPHPRMWQRRFVLERVNI